MPFIDLHNHCLWGVDDGVKNKEEAALLFQRANEDNVNVIFATPHFIPGKHTKEDLAKQRVMFKEVAMCAKQYNIELHLGCELYLNSQFYDALENKLLRPLGNTNYILVEFDMNDVARKEERINDYLYELTLLGYHPLIAHVERYFHKKVNLQMVNHWVKLGCYVQVNRSSLVGIYGETPMKNALQLVKEGYVHVIASDAHKATGKRTCCLSDAYQIVLKQSGKEVADVLCIKNPNRVFNNESTLININDEEGVVC